MLFQCFFYQAGQGSLKLLADSLCNVGVAVFQYQDNRLFNSRLQRLFDLVMHIFC